MTTRKGRFIFCIQIIVVLTKYTAGFQNETTDDYVTTTNSNDTTEFVWERMTLDDRHCWKWECPSLCYFGFNLLSRSESVRFDEEDGISVVYKPNMLEYNFGFTTRINEGNHRLHWRDICLLEEYLSERKVSGFEDVFRKNWFKMSYESEARYLINEEFEHPYSLLTYDCLTATNINVKSEFHIMIYDDYFAELICNDTTVYVFERMDLDDRDCWKCECPSLCYYDGTSVVYKPNMLEYSFGFTTRINDCNHSVHWRDIYLLEEYLSLRKVSGFEDVSRKTWFDKLNYQTSMESLHGIESTALLATFILTVLSMRIVSEEQLIKDTVSHSLIVKTTTNEARQNVPTKAEDEAVRHCELCINHDQAIAYCMTCKLYICMPCNDLHKRVWTLMNHTVCPFNHM